MNEKGFKSRLILQVHDELVFEVILRELDCLKELVRKCMEEVIAMRLPIKAKMKTGKNWLECGK